MKIKDVYSKYFQPPMLVTHQLRVASVGYLILNSLGIKDEEVVKALLFHDLGNIVRIKFGLFADEDYKELGVSFYKSKQEEVIQKYGNVDHDVTVKMLKEIGLNQRIVELVELIKWENIASAIDSDDIILKIINYSDMRVGPMGILSAIERIDEVNKRKQNWIEYTTIRKLVVELENQIFSKSKITPESIDNDIVNKTIVILENWDL